MGRTKSTVMTMPHIALLKRHATTTRRMNRMVAAGLQGLSQIVVLHVYASSALRMVHWLNMHVQTLMAQEIVLIACHLPTARILISSCRNPMEKAQRHSTMVSLPALLGQSLQCLRKRRCSRSECFTNLCIPSKYLLCNEYSEAPLLQFMFLHIC